MKKILLTMTLLLLLGNAFGQDQPATGYTREDYLKKSKTQRIMAILLVGGGVGTAIAGAALTDTYASDAGTWMIVGGGVLAASSIPLFISSSKNRKKADSMQVSAGIQPIYLPKPNGFAYKNQLAITLKIPL